MDFPKECNTYGVKMNCTMVNSTSYNPYMDAPNIRVHEDVKPFIGSFDLSLIFYFKFSLKNHRIYFALNCYIKAKEK